MSTTSAQIFSLRDAIVARDSLWLCLYFSQLALDVFEYDDEKPIAIIERRLVHCANRGNLPAGLALATAHALYPDLLALERQSEREREHMHQLAHWAYQFTPNVVIAERNSLLLEIGSCRRLYRGAQNLLKKIQLGLQQRHQSAELGLAHTPNAAWLLAACCREPALRGDRIDGDALAHQLAAVPIDTLAIAAESRQALEQMGLITVGAVCDLPAAALAKRFGTPFTEYLQKTLGTIPDPQRFFIPLPRFQYGLMFIDGITQRQMLLFPMKRLLRALDDYLRVRQLHCHTLQWQLFDAHRLQAEFSLELSRTQHRWQNLLELSRIKLDQVALENPVFSINLICEDFFEAAPAAQQLFPDVRDRHEAAAALIDRLEARVGSSALQRIALNESHWPELAWRCEKTSLPEHAADAIEEVQHPRPLWLLPQPKPLSQKNALPCWPAPLTLLRGPERIGNHWWQEESSERDYYIARNTSGVVCWIYRERTTQRWFLHGLFA